ncbi:MAG: AGE family epimerase/isomerase [Candidatus Puniceispirillaceae bacterium]
MTSYPDFTSPAFLTDHIASILDFYAPRARDPEGGFFHHFLDDGTVYDDATRHLVSSTRFVFNYASAFLHDGKDQHRDWAAHGLAYLRSHHQMPAIRQNLPGHFCWQRNDTDIEDARAMAYGHAFVMLAAAHGVRAEIDGATDLLEESWQLMEDLFWDGDHSAYADERDQTLDILSPYRGQNANMHAVEALLAAYESTNETRYLDRASIIAHKFTVAMTASTDGQIWEHYTTNWQHDWHYNIDKPDDLFKPWGYQPGHQVEWAKLLLQLNRHQPAGWHLDRACGLFDTAMEKGWDPVHGGLVYGYAPDGSFCDATKYFWVQAEAIAASWRLFSVTGKESYRQHYLHLWQWSWDHLVDHNHGAWFRIVTRDGQWMEPYKSPAGKVDYHTLGACYDILDAMKGK